MRDFALAVRHAPLRAFVSLRRRTLVPAQRLQAPPETHQTGVDRRRLLESVADVSGSTRALRPRQVDEVRRRRRDPRRRRRGARRRSGPRATRRAGHTVRGIFRHHHRRVSSGLCLVRGSLQRQREHRVTPTAPGVERRLRSSPIGVSSPQRRHRLLHRRHPNVRQPHDHRAPRGVLLEVQAPSSADGIRVDQKVEDLFVVHLVVRDEHLGAVLAPVLELGEERAARAKDETGRFGSTLYGVRLPRGGDSVGHDDVLGATAGDHRADERRGGALVKVRLGRGGAADAGEGVGAPALARLVRLAPLGGGDGDAARADHLDAVSRGHEVRGGGGAWRRRLGSGNAGPRARRLLANGRGGGVVVGFGGADAEHHLVQGRGVERGKRAG